MTDHQRYYVRKMQMASGWLVMDRYGDRPNDKIVGRYPNRKRARAQAQKLNADHALGIKPKQDEAAQ